MTGKEYLDEKYGTPRGNGYGIASILDDFAEEKIRKEILPTIMLIKERASLASNYVEILMQELIDKYEHKDL